MRKWATIPARRRRELILAAAQRDGYRCHLCGELIDPYDTTSDRRLSGDHVIPVAKGGAHTLDNLRPAHLDCNKRRGTKTVRRPVRRVDNLARFLET